MIAEVLPHNFYVNQASSILCPHIGARCKTSECPCWRVVGSESFGGGCGYCSVHALSHYNTFKSEAKT